MPSPVSRQRKSPVGMILLRLRQLADNCEERARRSHNADARNLYHLAARDARIAASGRGMGEDVLRATLIHIEELAAVARRYDGEEITSPDLLSAGFVPKQPVFVPLQFGECAAANIYLTGAPETLSHARPPDALNARQLGQLRDIPERTARRAIERGCRHQWPGFYREGGARAYWFADLDAFDRSRG